MVAKRSKKTYVAVKPKRKQTRRRRTSRRSGLGRIITKGVKSLVASIPVVGDVLKDIADVAFKHVGLTSVTRTPNIDEVFKGDVHQCSLVSRFHITPATIVACSSGAIQMDDGRTFMTQYAEGRLINLTIRINPCGVMGKMQGDWHLGFQPFYDIDTEFEPGIKEDGWLPSEQGIHRAFRSTTAPAHKPLQITYQPTVRDGKAYTYQDLDSEIGEVSIRYDSYGRDDFSEFKPSDISFDIKISGSVELRVTAMGLHPDASKPAGSGGYVHSATVHDKLKNVKAFVVSPKHWVLAIKDDAKYVCTSADGKCSLEGTVGAIRTRYESISLASMEIN